MKTITISKLELEKMIAVARLAGLELEIKIIEQKITNAYKREYYEIIQDLINYKDILVQVLKLERKLTLSEKDKKRLKNLTKLTINNSLYRKNIDYKTKLKILKKLK